MLKICHMTSAHNSNDTRIFYKECNSLAAAGYDTYLVAKGESREENGVHVIGVGNAPSERIKRMTTFAKTVYSNALEIDADLYHFHDPELLPYGLKLKKHGKKVIFDSHENHSAQLLEREYLPRWVRKYVSSLYKLWEVKSVREFDAVIVPCTFKKVNIFENSARKTAIVANYPIQSELYDKYNPHVTRCQYICYTGTMSEANGTTDLIKAAYRAKIPLVLAGGFSSRSYEDKLRGMKEFSNVDYRGQIGRDSIAEIMQYGFIGAYVNRHVGQNGIVDTFGIKVYEYMAMGLPVLVDDSPYAKNVINTTQCGLCVSPDNMEAIVEAIKYLLAHPDEAQKMGENGRRAVEQQFNWATQEKKLLDLYYEVLGEN